MQVIALVVTLDRVDEALGPYTEECLAGFVQLMMWSAPAIPAFEALKVGVCVRSGMCVYVCALWW